MHAEESLLGSVVTKKSRPCTHRDVQFAFGANVRRSRYPRASMQVIKAGNRHASDIISWGTWIDVLGDCVIFSSEHRESRTSSHTDKQNTMGSCEPRATHHAMRAWSSPTYQGLWGRSQKWRDAREDPSHATLLVDLRTEPGSDATQIQDTRR